MGRRSSHSPDELRAMILASTREIVTSSGLVGLSAREIARKIGYSAGTLYNVFENLDDLLLTIQIEMLADATAHMRTVPQVPDHSAHLKSLAEGYISYALSRRRLWNLLFQHHLPDGKDVPSVLHDEVNRIIAIVTAALAPLMPGRDHTDVDRTARVIWAGVHGISAIAVTDKSPTMTTDTAQAYVADLMDMFLASLGARRKAS